MRPRSSAPSGAGPPPYLAGLVGFDAGASDHQRNPDVKLVELPLVQRKRELTWRGGGRTFTWSPSVQPGGCGTHLCGSHCRR